MTGTKGITYLAAILTDMSRNQWMINCHGTMQFRG
jgi:hypothetical protein